MRWSVVLMGTPALWLGASAQPQLDDAALTAADGSATSLPDAQAEALLDHELRVTGVSSRVDDGVATLEGIVTSEADRARAEQLARRAEGVAYVQNRIIVAEAVSELVHAGAPLEPAVDSAVMVRLAADPRFAEHDIDARADDRNAVTLTGRVLSEGERTLAGRIAAETAGVTEVRNRLVVQPQ